METTCKNTKRHARRNRLKPAAKLKLANPSYNLSEAARILGISRDLVKRAIEGGLLAVYRFSPGKPMYRIYRSDLEEYLRKIRQGPPPKKPVDVLPVHDEMEQDLVSA